MPKQAIWNSNRKILTLFNWDPEHKLITLTLDLFPDKAVPSPCTCAGYPNYCDVCIDYAIGKCKSVSSVVQNRASARIRDVYDKKNSNVYRIFITSGAYDETFASVGAYAGVYVKPSTAIPVANLISN